jgi:ABC-type sugar transport system, periplasmic component
MKKLLSVILLATMFLTVLLSCGDGGGNSSADGTTTAPSGDSEETTIAEETEELGDKPDFDITGSDYEGAEFKILYPEWSLYNNFYFAEEANGEAMNDAIYERTAKIEEDLNIDIVPYTIGYIETILPEVRKTVLAGMDEYDLALTHCATDLTAYISDSLVMNWNKMPIIDMEKSYWNGSLRETVESSGMLAYAANDFVLPDVNTVFFNKTMIDDLTLENPYTLVNSGKWTWDKVVEMGTNAASDINGDGVFDDQDQYGFVGEKGWQFASITTGCDQYIVANQDGKSVLAANTSRMVNIVEKIHSMLKNGNIAFTWNHSGEYDPNMNGTPPVDFNAGRALFYLVPLSLASRFRAMDVEFGILPMPKLDDAQENYLSLNWAGYMCVPITAGDLEFTAKVVDLLGYYNSTIVKPAFYDILLGQKITRDEESMDMLDIVFNGSVYDFGVALSLYGITDTVVGNDGNFASYYEKNEKSWNNTIDKYVKACEDYMAVNG